MIRKGITMRLFAAIVVAAFALLSTPALARADHHTHPGCKAGYVRKHVWGKHHKRKVWRCEKRKHKTQISLPKPTVSYEALVDPTFTQAATNPLAVTYAYSADATSTVNGVTTDLAATGQLPDGILNFYSAQTPGGPETLYCSMNVGAAVVSGNCPVTYQQTGDYEVTTQYIPNVAAATTETDTEVIWPFATATALTSAAGACGNSSPPGYPTVPGPYCEYTLANTVTDQNGNAEGPQVTLTVTPTMGGAAGLGHVPAGGSCTVYVTSSWVLSPDCNFEAGSGLDNTASWSVTAAFQGSVGWSASTSAAETLMP